MVELVDFADLVHFAIDNEIRVLSGLRLRPFGRQKGLQQTDPLLQHCIFCGQGSGHLDFQLIFQVIQFLRGKVMDLSSLSDIGEVFHRSGRIEHNAHVNIERV